MSSLDMIGNENVITSPMKANIGGNRHAQSAEGKVPLKAKEELSQPEFNINGVAEKEQVKEVSEVLSKSRSHKMDPSARGLLKEWRAKIKAEPGGLEKFPILNLLQGKLSVEDEKNLIDLISENGFMNEVFSSDINILMQRGFKLSKLAGMLGMESSLKENIQSLGLNPNENISPAQLFKALGIDPNKIAQVLKNLKKNIPSQGLSLFGDNKPGVNIENEKKAPSLKFDGKRALYPVKKISEQNLLSQGQGKLKSEDKALDTTNKYSKILNPQKSIKHLETSSLSHVSNSEQEKNVEVEIGTKKDSFIKAENKDKSDLGLKTTGKIDFKNDVKPLNKPSLNISNLTTASEGVDKISSKNLAQSDSKALSKLQVDFSNKANSPKNRLKLNNIQSKPILGGQIKLLNTDIPGFIDLNESDFEKEEQHNSEKENLSNHAFTNISQKESSQVDFSLKEVDKSNTEMNQRLSLIENIKEKIKEISDGKNSLATIKIRDDLLGDLSLGVFVDGNDVSINMLNSSQKLSALLGRDLTQLRDSLSEQNLNLLNTDLQQEGGDSHSDSQKQSLAFDYNSESHENLNYDEHKENLENFSQVKNNYQSVKLNANSMPELGSSLLSQVISVQA